MQSAIFKKGAIGVALALGLALLGGLGEVACSQPLNSDDDLKPVVFQCVVKDQQATAWCGKWELGCRGKGPYLLVAAREQPATCVGAAPALSFDCETTSGVSRGQACTPWE